MPRWKSERNGSLLNPLFDMKISNVKNTRLSFNSAAKRTETETKGPARSAEVVSLSGLSSELSGFVQELANSSPREEMGEIKEQLARGQYEVDAEKLAERLMSHPMIARALGVG